MQLDDLGFGGGFDFTIPGGGSEGIFSGVTPPVAPEIPSFTPAFSSNLSLTGNAPSPALAPNTLDLSPRSSPDGGGTDLAGLAKTVAPYVQAAPGFANVGLGIQSLALAKKGQQAQLGALKTEQQAAQPAAAAAGALIPAGTSAVLGGPLPPGLEAEAQTYEQNLRAQYRQMFAHLQISEGTGMAQVESLIAQQVAAYRQQLAQSVLSAGTGAAGTAIQGGNVSGSQGRQLGGDVTQVLTDTNNALSKMLAAA